MRRPVTAEDVIVAGLKPKQSPQEVKVHFQGLSGSGKSVMMQLLAHVLDELHVTYQTTPMSDWHRPNRVIDLETIDCSDTLTVKLDTDGLMKVLEAKLKQQDRSYEEWKSREEQGHE
jgi:hypothetical protein